MPRVEVASDRGVIVFRDASVPAPVGNVAAAVSELRAAARDGAVFLLDTDDAVSYRIDVYIDAKLPALPDAFEPRGGSFRLDLPTGTLAVCGIEGWSAPAAALPAAPGSYVLRVYGPGAFDAHRHDAEMIRLLGDADWSYRRRVDRLGLVGCLPTLLVLAPLLFRRWRFLLAYALAAAVASWLPFFLSRRTTRYRTLERRIRDHERSKPHWIVELTRRDDAVSIDGGFLQLE